MGLAVELELNSLEFMITAHRCCPATPSAKPAAAHIPCLAPR